jgi:hypothetical protein
MSPQLIRRRRNTVVGALVTLFAGAAMAFGGTVLFAQQAVHTVANSAGISQITGETALPINLLLTVAGLIIMLIGIVVGQAVGRIRHDATEEQANKSHREDVNIHKPIDEIRKELCLPEQALLGKLFSAVNRIAGKLNVPGTD